MRIRRIAAVAALTLAIIAIPGGFAARGEEADLFGYSVGATGAAISFLYNQPSFGVPTDPTFELRKVYSKADLDAGPSSHGIGSVLWPGDVIGNAPPNLLFDTVIFNPTQIKELDPVLQQLKEQGANATAGSAGYPVRAEAFYPSNKSQDEKDVGAGVRMTGLALEDRAEGSSQTGGAGAGLINFGTISSHSTSLVEKGQVVSSTITKITDLDIFGFVQIRSLIATATATSDGVAGKTEGSLRIAGMVIKDQTGADQLNVTLDKTGLHVTYPNGKQDQDPLKALTDAVKQYLEPQGLTIKIGEPISTIDGAAASRSLAGLTLHLDAYGMNTLLENENFPADIRTLLKNPTGSPLLKPIFGENGVLSPTVAGFLASFFQGDQTLDFVFGSVAVSAAAAPALPAIEIPPITTPPLVSTPPLGGDFGGFPGTPGGTGGPGGIQTLGSKPVGVVGVPLGYLLVALAVAIAGATRLRLFADRVTSAAPSVRCLMGEE
ncbi:MAG: hypothetical protein WAT66_16605 [Actinomycetota bacterium]